MLLEESQKSIIHLHQSIITAEESLKKQQTHYNKAITEAARWSKRIELAKTSGRSDLALAASNQAHEHNQVAHRLGRQMIEHENTLILLKATLTKLKDEFAKMQAQRAKPQAADCKAKEASKVTSSIESLEKKLTHIAALVQESIKELSELKSQVLFEELLTSNTHVDDEIQKLKSKLLHPQASTHLQCSPDSAVDAELEDLKQQLDQL